MRVESSSIEHLLSAQRWRDAAVLIRRALRQEPEDHWLWARLSSALYQQRKYAKALEAAEAALFLEPDCSLAMWEKADCLQLLGEYERAAQAFQAITSKGMKGLARGACFEGRAWARGLLSDSHYKLARGLARLERFKPALKELKKARLLRRGRFMSMFTLKEIVELERWIEARVS